VTRVAKEVGTEGKLGGQAVVKGCLNLGISTDNVNGLQTISRHSSEYAKVTTAWQKEIFLKRSP